MKVLKIFLSIAIIVYTLAACDKVEGPYKEEIVKPDTDKKVLLEDFTGHRCVFCPGAQEIAHELAVSYGEENLIVVSIHAGFLSWPFPNSDYDYDFQTEAGTEYFEYFSIDSPPNGLVDRVNSAENYVIPPANWGTVAASQFEEENVVNIEILPSLNGTKLSATVNLDFITDINLQTNLQIWITEDSIINPQTVPESQGSIIYDYVHNHVLRGAINGTWGEALPSASYAAEDIESIDFSDYQLGDDWVAKQLALIVFLYDQESKKVLQVEKIKIME